MFLIRAPVAPASIAYAPVTHEGFMVTIRVLNDRQRTLQPFAAAQFSQTSTGDQSVNRCIDRQKTAQT
ncbi:MAG: hypothetical protein ACI9JL_003029 [Paracoccaceae bacterium]